MDSNAKDEKGDGSVVVDSSPEGQTEVKGAKKTLEEQEKGIEELRKRIEATGAEKQSVERDREKLRKRVDELEKQASERKEQFDMVRKERDDLQEGLVRQSKQVSARPGSTGVDQQETGNQADKGLHGNAPETVAIQPEIATSSHVEVAEKRSAVSSASSSVPVPATSIKLTVHAKGREGPTHIVDQNEAFDVRIELDEETLKLAQRSALSCAVALEAKKLGVPQWFNLGEFKKQISVERVIAFGVTPRVIPTGDYRLGAFITLGSRISRGSILLNVR